MKHWMKSLLMNAGKPLNTFEEKTGGKDGRHIEHMLLKIEPVSKPPGILISQMSFSVVYHLQSV